MNCAVIMAAGKGKRMHAKVNKQFINLNDKPILAHTISKFEQNSSIDEIVIVVSRDEIEKCLNEVIYKYNFKKVRSVVAGGRERQESVLNGLKELKNVDIVLIHDGARPFVDDRIIEEGIKYASIYGGSACGVVPKDTIKLRDENGFSSKTLDRNSLFCVQTPQCFKFDEIFDAHLQAETKGIIATDDTKIFEMAGRKVYLYDGSYDNIKITTYDDIYTAEKILNKSV